MKQSINLEVKIEFIRLAYNKHPLFQIMKTQLISK